MTTFLYFNCKRTNLDQVLTLKVTVGSIEDKLLKMTLGPYGLNVKDMVLDLNKLLKRLPEGLEVYISIYLFKDLSFILIPKGVSISTLFFMVSNRIKENKENITKDILIYNNTFNLQRIKVLLICLKLKVLLEKEMYKSINSGFNQKNGEIINLRQNHFSENDFKCLLGTLKSFSEK